MRLTVGSVGQQLTQVTSRKLKMFGDVAQPEEYQTVEFTVYKNAKVMSPFDMPDYMLDYTIAKA